MRVENVLHVESQIQISSPSRLNLFSQLNHHYSKNSRPLDICNTIFPLMDNRLLCAAQDCVTQACRNHNLCMGLKEAIKGAVHNICEAEEAITKDVSSVITQYDTTTTKDSEAKENQDIATAAMAIVPVDKEWVHS